MRIVFVVPSVSFQVAEKYYNVQSFGLAHELSNLGHQVLVITSSPKYNSLGKLVKVKDSFEVLYLPTLTRLLDHAFLSGLFGKLLQSNCDIIQACEDSQPSSFTALLASKIRHIPLVIYQGIYSYLFGALSMLYYSSFPLLIRKNADFFIAKTNSARDFLLKYGVSPFNIAVIPPGIDTRCFKPTKDLFKSAFGYNENDRLILTVSRLSSEKGLNYLIESMVRVIREFPDAKLLILGGGPLEPYLQDLIGKLNLQNNVKIRTSLVPNREMYKAYAAAEFTVFSAYYEPFGMTRLESLSCGKTTITINTGGAKDFIKDGVTGYLISPRSSEALAEKIMFLLGNKKTAERMGMAGMKYVQEHFDWKVLAPKYVEVYRKAVHSL